MFMADQQIKEFETQFDRMNPSRLKITWTPCQSSIKNFSLKTTN